MKLNSGNIYKFRYTKYKKDPTPTALILYNDTKEKLVHAINLNALDKKMTDYLIEFIARVAAKQLNPNMYKLYHGTMKQKLPRVLQKAYRTYKPSGIISPKQITMGYWGVRRYLLAFTIKPETKIRRAKSVIKKQLRKSGFRAQINIADVKRAVEKYAAVSAALTKVFDKDEFTGIGRKK